ncbi:MAG: flavodoxin family protein [Methanospirillum sp.]
MDEKEIDTGDPKAVRSLVVVFSYHHGNTGQIADAVAQVLGAEVTTPRQVKPEEIAEYDLVGFGSGIYSAQHHESLLDLADTLPRVTGKNAFIFSTYGAPAVAAGGDFVKKNHSRLREKLQAKGYSVIGEFGCAGWNTNSFLKVFGGLNKGRPNAEDLEHAGEFARNLKEKAR